MLPGSFGRYEIRQEIGRGGMAQVYLAIDPTFRRQVAVKLLPSRYLENPLLRARFEREARLIATIEHPAIVPVYDFGEQDGQLYLVMRYMPGGSLAGLIQKGPLSLAQAADLMTPLAQALDAVHSRGIVHRDLKPGNILFDTFGNPALSDFGIAHLSEATVELTGEAIIGTPAYMSPEQVRGEPDLDGRSDVYALGIILFEMLSGRQPYQAATPMSIAMRHLTEPVPEIRRLQPDLPESLQMVLDRALAKEREERYPRASDLAFDLRSLVESSSSRVSPPESPPGVRVVTSEGTENLQGAERKVDPAGATEVDAHSAMQRDGTPPLSGMEAPAGTLTKVATLPGEQPLKPAIAGGSPPMRGGTPAVSRMRIVSFTGLGGLALILVICAMAILAYLGIRNLLPTRLTPTQSDAVVGSLPTFDIDGTRPPVTTPELASATPQPSAATQTTAQAVTMSPTGLPTPVLFDDFSTLINDWPQGDQAGGGYNYADGAYLIEVLENGSLYWAAPKGSFSDLKMSVAAQRVSGDQGYYGLLCRIQDNQNFYYFIVRPDGQFTIGKYESGEFTALTPGGWTYHPTIQIGNAVNHLEAECAGDQLRFSANGEVLGEVNDSSFSSGKLGLVAAALDDQGFQASFDNFEVHTVSP